MSNEVDKRIIEMEFKNDQFEKNAAKTLQTLQELKQKLNNNFSTKGAEELNRAIKSVDVSPISQGLETVQLKFNALQIAGKRVIENIVDAAMNAVHQVTSKLTGVINQIKVGGANRAQNIEAAKFMLSGLGIEWADIVDDINYGVQDTAYGLDAAARVASQLVASNVTLGKDMQASLRAVSGVAAMTNSTYEDIGHIFTSVAGQGKLMTMQLQQFSLRGLNVAADLAKYMHTTEAAIREMVTKGQIDFMTFAKAMDELYGEHAKEANKTFTGALSNTKAALSRLGADIQSQKFESFRIILLEVTTQLKDFKKAIKPAEDAIIEMMAAVGNLVANFVKTANLKAIAEKLVPPIKKAAEYVRDFANAWRELREEATPVNTMAEYVQKLKGGMEETTEATDEALTSIEKLAKASDTDLKRYAENAWAIWNEGKFGKGQDRIDALGEDYELTQAYVDKMIELGWDEAKMNEYLNEQREKAQKQQAKEQVVNRLKLTVSKILTIFTNIRRVITNITSSIGNIIKAMFGGLTEAFVGKGKGFLDGMVTITGAIADFSDKLVITKERAEKIRPITKIIGDIVVTIGKGLITVVKYLLQFIKAASESKIVQGLFSAIGHAISGLIKGIENLYNKLKESGIITKVVDILKTIGEWIGIRIINALNTFGDIMSTIGTTAFGIWEKLSEKIKGFGQDAENGSSWLDKIKDFFKGDPLKDSWLDKLKDILGEIFGTGKDVFQTAFNKGSDFINGLVQGLKNLSKQDLDNIIKSLTSIALTLSTIKWLWSMVAMNKSFTGIFKGIDKAFETIGVTLKKYGKRADAERFQIFVKSIRIMVGSLIALMVTFAALEYFKFDATRILNITVATLGAFTILIGAIFTFNTWLEKKNYINQVGNKSISLFANTKIPSFALNLLAIAFMIQTLMKTVMTIYNMVKSGTFDVTTFGVISAAIVGILIGMGAFVAIISKQAPKMAGLSGLAFVIISIGILISTMVSSLKKVLKMIQGYDRKTVNKAVDVIKEFLTPLLIFAGVIALVPKILDKIPGGGTNAANINNNPFKGMMGMMIGLAALMRFGFLPLLESIAEVRKDGQKGVDAIDTFKSIVNSVMIFVGLLTVVVLLLDRTVRKDGKVFGSEFVDGKYVGDVTTGGKFTTSNNKGVWGIVGIVAAMSAVFFALSSVMKNMHGVDSHAIARFKEMAQSILVVITIISAIGSIVGLVDKTGTAIGVLLALAAVIASVAATFLAAGYGFKAFEEALTDLIEKLPDLLDKLVEFFRMIASDSGGGHYRGSVRNELITGIRDMASLFFEGATAAVVGWTEGLKNSIPEMVHNVMLALIVTLNSVADELNEQGPALVNAADRACTAFLKFLALVISKLLEKGKAFFKAAGEKLGGLIIENMNPWIKSALGLDDLHWNEAEELSQAYWDKQAELEKKAYEKAMRENNPQDADWYAGYYGGASAETKGFEIMGEDQMDKAVKAFSDGAMKKLGSFKFTDLQSFMGDNFNLENIMGEMKLGDFSSIGNLGVDTNGLSTAFENFDWGADNAAENAEGIINDFITNTNTSMDSYVDGYSNYGEEAMDNYGEAIHERMEFVTDITDEAGDAAVDRLKKFDSKFYDAGKFCAEGFADGLINTYAKQRIKLNAYELVDISKKAIQTRADEHSPSKVFMKLGQFITVGFANGIIDAVSTASGAANDVGEATILSMRETIKRASFEAVEGIDNPRITPILDLSNVAEGVGEMRGLFDTTPAYKLAMATSGEAKTATRNRLAAIYQNGSSYDDTNAIGAINSLNSEVATLKDAINGMQVVMDSKALVGQIATPMDKALGKMAIAGRRGI